MGIKSLTFYGFKFEPLIANVIVNGDLHDY